MILIPSTKLGGMNGFILLTAPSEKPGLLRISLLSSLSALLLFSGLSLGCEGLPGGGRLLSPHNAHTDTQLFKKNKDTEVECVCVCLC